MLPAILGHEALRKAGLAGAKGALLFFVDILVYVLLWGFCGGRVVGKSSGESVPYWRAGDSGC